MLITALSLQSKLKQMEIMNIQEIKIAVDKGILVNYKTPTYRVIKDSINQYLIMCSINGSCIGLTNIGGDKLNGHESDFYYENPHPQRE